MLRQLDMGGGNATNPALFAEGTDLMGLMQIYGQIGNHHTAPTAVRRWTEVTTMRLIDADQMAVDESEAYMSAQVQITDDLKWLVNFAAHSKIQRIIAETPTVDAVPVVRCRDCINAEPLERNCEVNANFYMHCRLWRGEECKNVWHKYKRYYRDYSLVQHDDFCSSGERKEGVEC